MENALVRVLGWRATILHGDPTVADRWEWVKAHLKQGPVWTLEAGCGTGAFSLFAARQGNFTVGLSFNERNNHTAAERAKILKLTNVQFRQVDLRYLDEVAPSLGKFDQVICLETIEHLLEDQKLVTQLAALLKEGGQLLLTTPFKWHHPLIGEHPDREYRASVEDGGHVRFGYTEREVRTLCETAGLRVRQVDFLSGYLSQTLYSWICKLDQRMPHSLAWAITFPLRILRKLDKAVTKRMGYPALSLAVIADKPHVN